jgi:hypothetical protein
VSKPIESASRLLRASAQGPFADAGNPTGKGKTLKSPPIAISTNSRAEPESMEKLWDYRYEGAMLNYLQKWIDQLRWQRLPAFQKLAEMLLKHLDGILNYCRTRVRFGVVEAINGNIRMLINRGRGYTNMRYLLLKSQRMAVTNTEYIAFKKIRKAA